MTTQQLEFATTDAVCGLVAADPSNQPTVDAFLGALHQAVKVHGAQVTANHVRPFLPSWANPRVVSAQYNVLRKAGVLTRLHRAEEPSKDHRGRNGNKACPWYFVDVTALSSAMAAAA